MERGVFDIEVVKQANQTLIDTIEESLRIADEGKAAREGQRRANPVGSRSAPDLGRGQDQRGLIGGLGE